MQIAQLSAAVATAADPIFSLLIAVLGALFLLVVGGYAYTWKSTTSLWRAIENHLNSRLNKIEKRVSDLED